MNKLMLALACVALLAVPAVACPPIHVGGGAVQLGVASYAAPVAVQAAQVQVLAAPVATYTAYAVPVATVASFNVLAVDACHSGVSVQAVNRGSRVRAFGGGRSRSNVRVRVNTR